MKLSLASILAVALLAPGAALAHHGWAGQDSSKVTVLEGTIERVRYANPHAEIELTSGGQRWQVTLAPITRMEGRGITQDVLTVGKKVRIEGNRNTDPNRYEVKASSISIAGAQSVSMMR